MHREAHLIISVGKVFSSARSIISPLRHRDRKISATKNICTRSAGGLSSKNNASSSSLALHYSLHQKAFFQKHHHSWPYHHVDSHFVVRFDPPASACLAFFKLKSGKKRIPRATEKKLHNVYGWRFVPDYARVTALRMTIRSSLPMLRKPCSQSKSLHGILLPHFYFKLNGVRRRCFSRHNFVIYKYFSER